MTPSSREGMGGTVQAGGAAFRVWAPHAEKVFVTGTFNGWSKDASPLAAVNLGLLDPFIQRLGRTADLRGNRTHRRPAGCVLALVFQNHPNRAGPDFR